MTRIISTVLLAFSLCATPIAALEPPTAEQLERYRLDGTLEARIEAAKSYGNHRMSPQLAARFSGRHTVKALPAEPKVLPAEGAPAVLTLLIAFDDMLGYTDPEVVEDRVFGDGEVSGFPYESLTSFYRRSSYGLLEITGNTLGWYTTPYPREDVTETYVGRQTLIKEVITHFDDEGHDFSQYDNDGDGFMDYVAIIWTGAPGEWGDFWWGYQTRFWNDSFTVDGVQIGTYSWQWENYNWPGEFSPEVLIHETGHALGLPDYYDYDDEIGPRGGVGGLDQMAGNWGDHNAFSKWVLGWLEPRIFNEDLHDVVLSPTDEFPRAAVFMHGDPITDPYAEYFIVQVRRPEGNDAEIPGDGILIWHVDARVDDNGYFLYDNSYTEHKLLRLMEADGLEEIERGGGADAGDFYNPGDRFDTDSTPSSHRYDGVPTNIYLGSFSLSWAGPDRLVTADLGSGCALWCDASVTPSAWPGLPVDFNGSLSTANCDGEASYGWVFGDGGGSGDTSASHVYVSSGDYDWNVTAGLEDAECAHRGTIRVCTDFQCWQWSDATEMASGRSSHDAVTLADGRLFVVGSDGDTGSAAEIYDPITKTWTAAAASVDTIESPRAARLTDGRVLVVDDEHTEIYNPADDSWTLTEHLNNDRILHSAVTMDDGRVLVAGGLNPTGYDEAVTEVEVYDPYAKTWSVVGSLPGERYRPAMVKLSDGRVLIVGGRSANAFDPVSEELTRETPLPDEWQWPVAALLDDGRVLMSGVANGGMTLLWNPANGRLSIAGSHNAVRNVANFINLPNGFVLVAGGLGSSGRVLDSTEFFDPATETWSTGSSLVTARFDHTATLLSTGEVILTGGADNYGTWADNLSEVEVLTQPTSPPRSIGGRITP